MKIRYSNWTRDRQISPVSLRFDPDNPRLRGVEQKEKAIIHALCDTEDVSELLRKICRMGLAPIERLVVIYDEKKPIVIEGNRRLATYKMLLDPSLAPQNLSGLVRQARNELGDSELPSKVGCDIPPDHAEARIYAYMKHAEDKFFRPWAKIQQAVVDCSIADAQKRGEPVDIELTETQIKEARAMVEFYRLAGIFSRDENSSIKNETLRDFHYEAVKRVFLGKDAMKMLGISTDTDGVTIRGDLEKFFAFFRKTLEKMGEGRATRIFNSVEQAKDWISENQYQPEGNKTTRLAVKIAVLDGDNESSPNSEPPTPDEPKPKPHKDRRKSKVFPQPLVLEYDSPRLATVLKEVEKLKIENQSNTAAVMVRCVLELGIAACIKERKLEKTYTQWLQGNQDTLWKRIEWLRQTKPIPMDRDTDRLLSSLTNGKIGKVTLESLNGWVHSSWCPASSEDVRSKATELTPLLTILLSKPE